MLPEEVDFVVGGDKVLEEDEYCQDVMAVGVAHYMQGIGLGTYLK